MHVRVALEYDMRTETEEGGSWVGIGELVDRGGAGEAGTDVVYLLCTRGYAMRVACAGLSPSRLVDRGVTGRRSWVGEMGRAGRGGTGYGCWY